eukprot:Gregarina_sp_Poly_1__4894@NODE_25_length_19863_cov_179_262730_g23_i0_p14_GENE_NODE_25_length_19863_cov_179_262730_g23_i0NODE_25_length_19863_cov_179_262730_g23_i0_p14_ORF_typecomplete_len103_score25_26_NODE_25_length_19863_cov_179_262730_g23_i01342513733
METAICIVETEACIVEAEILRMAGTEMEIYNGENDMAIYHGVTETEICNAETGTAIGDAEKMTETFPVQRGTVICIPETETGIAEVAQPQHRFRKEADGDMD